MRIVFVIVLLFVNILAFSQDHSKDVKSLDAIVEALYGSISGEKGEPRQWDLFSSLFTDNAQLVPTNRNEEGVAGYVSWTPGEYRERADEWLVSNGFHEVEIHRVVEKYGPVVHIFSTYESRNSLKEKDPFARGINSIQLLDDGERWWIMSIYWSAETEDNPIPAKYLPK